ncbi:PASTA domain-containing protein [Kribbella sp. C-35]|uniref:PASTA domain-containing protein n=1 Tax=Kribbella sp. C-35 TaxID=2789276 RepID=UPI00397BF82B
MSIHRVRYLIAAAALAIATLLPAGTAAAGVAEDACAETAEWTASPPAVPKVLGLSLGTAADRLRDAGYNCKVVNYNFVQVGEKAVVVVKQELQGTGDPDGGFVVALTRGVVMPDLVGKTLAEAEKIAARRTIGIRTSPANGAADWTVEFQNPGAGTYMMFGDEAGLKLSEPVPPSPVLVPVPDLINSTEDQAAALVKDAGLTYKERILADGEQPGRVVSQRPQPGELVERASTVTADVRRVPTPPTPPPTTVVPPTPPVPPAVVHTVVPDVVGRLESTAKQAVGVARLTFRSRVVRPGNAPGIVLNQHPRAGTEVDIGTVVAVDVTRAPKPKLVPVPDLLNRGEDEARGAVEGVELIFALVGGSGRDRQVISQQPRPGELVPTGTTVTVELAASESNWPSWLVPLVLVTAVLAAGTVSRIRHRPGTHPKPVPHVQAAGRLAPGIPQIHESAPAHRIRINARLDPGRQYLQEKTDEHQ